MGSCVSEAMAELSQSPDILVSLINPWDQRLARLGDQLIPVSLRLPFALSFFTKEYQDGFK